MIRVAFLLMLLALLGCGGRSAPRDAAAELLAVATSYTNADFCTPEETALCYDRLDVEVTVRHAGGAGAAPLEVALERFTLTAASGASFTPLPQLGPCSARLGPGESLHCTLPFFLTPPLPAADLFPARLAFPAAPAAEVAAPRGP